MKITYTVRKYETESDFIFQHLKNAMELKSWSLKSYQNSNGDVSPVIHLIKLLLHKGL